jgi:amino acid transporter
VFSVRYVDTVTNYRKTVIIFLSRIAAHRGHIPKAFSHRSKHGTPTYGVILGTIVIVIMGASDLDSLIEMLNFNYAIALLMEYAAFFKLRIAQPNLDRPFKIPLSTFGCFLLFAPTIIMVLLVLSLATYTTFIFCIAVNIVGVIIFQAKLRSEKTRAYEEEGENDSADTEKIVLEAIETYRLESEKGARSD